MAKPVIMPKFEMSQEEATIIEWLKQEGDEVEKGAPILTVETDKVTIEVEAPDAGILKGLRGQPGEVIPVTEVIGYVLQPGEPLPEGAGAAPTPAPALKPSPAARPTVEDASGGAATPVARRLAAAKDVDLSAIEGTGVGGRITKRDVETAAAASAVQAPQGKVRATPAARRMARERGVDLVAVDGSGPRGRVQAGDVEAFAALPTPAAPLEVIPLVGKRRTIAERMTSSYQTAPHITLTVRVDMDAFEETRTRLNARAEAAGQTRASVTALLVKAVAWALKRHPLLNSTLQDEEIHLLPEINVGVAVALEEGLIVPVVHQADRKVVAKIAAEVKDLAVRAREDRLTPSDVSEGTFTVSNLGPLGIDRFTAIINPPQAAILAVGAARQEAVVDAEGQVAVCPVMDLTLSADHRIVDGAVAAHFLTDLREALESPALLLW